MRTSILVFLCILSGCSSSSPAVVENRVRLDFQPGMGSVEPFVSVEARQAFTRSCASCHGPDGWGIAAVGSDLRRAKRRTPEEWEQYLRDSSGSHPAGQPPPLWITGDELKAVAVYVDSLSTRAE